MSSPLDRYRFEMLKSWTIVVAGLVIVGGCAGGEAADVGPTVVSTPIASTAAQLEPLEVIGAGRATRVSSPDGTSAVVATTIGVSELRPDGAATTVPTGVVLPVQGVAISPDATHAAVTGATSTEVWSLGPTPTLAATFDGTATPMFASNSTTLIAAGPTQVTATDVGGDGTARVLIEAPTGTQLGAVTMTPDASKIAAPVSGEGPDLVTYDDATGAVAVDVLTDPDRHLVRAEYTTDGEHLLFTASSGDPFQEDLTSWSPAGGIEWTIDVGGLGTGTSWDVGADGRVLLADDSGTRIVGRDGAVGEPRPLDGPQTVTSIVATRSGYVISFSNSTLIFTDLDGVPVGPPVSTGRPLVDLAPLTATDGVSSVDLDGTIRSWTGQGVLIAESGAFRGGSVNDVAWSPDGQSVAFGSTVGVATVASVATPTSEQQLAHPEGNVDAVAFAHDGSTLLTGVGERLSDIAFDDTVSRWDLSDGTRIDKSDGLGEDVNGCANFRNTVRYSPDGTMYAVSAHDFTVSIHRSDTGELLQTLPPNSSTVLDFAFSPSGDRLVTTSDDGIVQVWSLSDFTMLSQFVGPPGGYWSLAFMPDGTSIVASDLTGAIRQVDVTSGTEILAYTGATSRTGRLAVSPDGTLLAAAADGNSVGLWSTTTGQQISRTEGHQAPVTSTAFSSDGSQLATSSADGTVRIWRV